MKIIKKGFKTFSAASTGSYNKRTAAVNKFRDEMLNGQKQTMRNDKDKIIQDRRSVAKDIKKSFDKLM